MQSYPVAQPRPRCVENRNVIVFIQKRMRVSRANYCLSSCCKILATLKVCPSGLKLIFVKVEPRSTFTFTRGLLYIASISFTGVNFTCVRTEKMRDSGNQP